MYKYFVVYGTELVDFAVWYSLGNIKKVKETRIY